MKCPFCKSENIDAEFIDIGIGHQQATPYECIDCGASQMNPYSNISSASKEEIDVGWYKGEYWESESDG